MKTSNEWIRDIYEKADKRFAAQKRRRKMIVKISSSAACLALILCTAVAVPDLFGNKDLSVPAIDNPNDNHKMLFAGNEILSETSAALQYRAPQEHYEEIWTKAQVTEYLGVDLTALSLYMPDDLAYSQGDDFRILFHNSGEIVEDYQKFDYEGENNRKVEVLVGKVMQPYDCIYNLESNDTTPVGSHGVSHDVLFGVKSNNEDSLRLNFCFADFEDGGLCYRIKANNLTAKEFYGIVEGITGLK